jgi:hypothetical protein
MTDNDDARAVAVPDPLVRRVNDLTTTFLDTIGVLLFGAAVCWWGWAYHPATGLALAGLAVTILSGLAQRRNTPRPAKVPPGAHPHLKPLPGPEHPGTVHVKGR